MYDKVYIKKKVDSDRIKQELQILGATWELNSRYVSVGKMWNDFERNIRHIMDTCIPNKMSSSRHNLPRFNRSLGRQTRTKQRL